MEKKKDPTPKKNHDGGWISGSDSEGEYGYGTLRHSQSAKSPRLSAASVSPSPAQVAAGVSPTQQSPRAALARSIGYYPASQQLLH